MLSKLYAIWHLLSGKPIAIVANNHYTSFDQQLAVYKALTESGVRKLVLDNYTRSFTVSPADYRDKPDADLRLKLYKHLVK